MGVVFTVGFPSSSCAVSWPVIWKVFVGTRCSALECPATSHHVSNQNLVAQFEQKYLTSCTVALFALAAS